jgi:hypothetical protein
MIRVAIPSDRFRVIQLARDSRIGAGFDNPDGLTGFVFPFDAAYAERLFRYHVTDPHALCLVNDVDGIAQGVLMAVAAEHPFGPVWMARETLWWIDPSHRGTAAVRMLDAFESWAGSQGCSFAGMAGMGDDPTVGILYQRRGYRVAETHYLKALRAPA